jgi:CDP-glycerol glycerophosphotransferase (TagB/SpsB family)
VQAAQVAAVASLHAALTREGFRVVVKPHPRESPEQYAFARPEVAGGDPADILAVADVAVAGASTVIEEAAILGCPVLVLGSIVHPPAFRSLLPDPSVFPRFDTVAEGVHLIQRQSDPAHRRRLLEAQHSVILAEVSFSPGVSAAANVADAILGT